MRGDSDSPYSFQDWVSPDPLPEFDDHVSEVKLTRPFHAGDMLQPLLEEQGGDSRRRPYHQAFGEPSTVGVRAPANLRETHLLELCDADKDLAPINLRDTTLLELCDADKSQEVTSSAGIGNLDVELGSDSTLEQSEIGISLSSDLVGDDNDDDSSENLPWVVSMQESGEQEFTIYLDFPGTDRPRMKYWVYAHMPVRQLYRLIASRILGCEDREIRIFVGTKCLLHLGTVTDRFFPDHPDVPTVFLVPECIVSVRRFTEGIGVTFPDLPSPDQMQQITFAGATAIIAEDEPPILRRASSRVSRAIKSKDSVPLDPVVGKVAPRRPVRDRWYFDTVLPSTSTLMGSSEEMDEGFTTRQSGEKVISRESSMLDNLVGATDKWDAAIARQPDTVRGTQQSDAPAVVLVASVRGVVPESLILGPVMELAGERLLVPIDKQQRTLLLRKFIAEGRYRRRMYRSELEREWESQIAPSYDQENDFSGSEVLVDEEIAFDGFMAERLARYDLDFDEKRENFLDDLTWAALPDRLISKSESGKRPDSSPDELLLH